MLFINLIHGKGGNNIVITNDQIQRIIDGKSLYVSCDYCGKHGAVVDGPEEVLGEELVCPICHQYCSVSGEGWDEGFYGCVIWIHHPEFTMDTD